MIARKQAYQECLSFVKNELSASVLVDKYFHSIDGNYLETTPPQMWRRIAKANASAEPESLRGMYEQKYYDLLTGWNFMPAGRMMYGLGLGGMKVTLKNCYVIAIRDDSIEGIFRAAYEIAETLKAGGGVGLDISPIRPRGSPIHNAARFSSGAVSFMDFFSHITGMIGQNARIGAMLMCIDISHPDVEEFISIKGTENLNLVRFSNISVKITDEFMKCVEGDKDFDLRWGGKVYKTVKARDLWNKIIHFAWKRAEPGLLFWDTVKRESTTDHYARFISLATNPCGETQLSDGDSCNLASLNLGKYVRKSFKPDAYFDLESFNRDVRLGIRFLDNIITLEQCPLEFQQWANDNGRRLGLGIMGLGDALMRMRIKYDTDQACQQTDLIMSNYMNESYDESCNLAEERGPFPVFEVERHMKSGFIQRLPDRIKNRIKTKGIRNIALHAVAPTGSLMCVAQCTGSAEPMYAVSTFRKTNLGTAKEVVEHEIFNPTVKEYMDETGCTKDQLPDYFVGAHQIDPKFRIKLQKTINKYVDQSISNTINLPNTCTEEEISDLYSYAWQSGLKGVTVYRDGSREGVLSTTKSIDSTKDIVAHRSPKRPESLEGVVHIIKPNGKKYTVFVGLLGERVYEVFALDSKLVGIEDGMKGQIIKERDKDNQSVYNFEMGLVTVRHINRHEDSDASTITRLISTALRHGTPLEFVINQITKSKSIINSLPRAVAKALTFYVKPDEIKGKFKCPKCLSLDIKHDANCFTCLSCGHSKCS